MKKLLIVLGGLFIVVLVIGGAAVAYFAITGSALDRESKAYANAAIPAIVDGWNEDALETRASPEFRSMVSGPNLDRVFGMLHRLGALTHYDGAKGEAKILVTPQHGRQITADYIGSADFNAGHAQITLRLIKHGDRWQILAFRVDSPVFFQK